LSDIVDIGRDFGSTSRSSTQRELEIRPLKCFRMIRFISRWTYCSSGCDPALLGGFLVGAGRAVAEAGLLHERLRRDAEREAQQRISHSS
jgi:hypothetical protein